MPAGGPDPGSAEDLVLKAFGCIVVAVIVIAVAIGVGLGKLF